ncbi:MAG: fibronectin type III domain-containing protein [Actinomycetota bacterium]|nr:fibronectin type III domain-containing protein [Actinomycetota bacterium]MDH5225292.1 fibronectin type III domain-containing protein [Actinomycetota bacterium]MDH5313608.1 fibronectin type III domain-containing protein [Actinomycetota bacterium]
MNAGQPNPSYPNSIAEPDTPARRDRRLATVLLVSAVVVLVAGVLWFTRSPGPPTAPVALRVAAETCDEPCDAIKPSVTIEWTPPERGATATGYRLLRDGAPLEVELDGTQRMFVDEDVTIGEQYAYQLVALSDEGDSAPTAEHVATVPTPPDEVAHLDGVYRVRLTVRSASSIGAAFGIENPLPGKRGTDRWSFTSNCDDDVGACTSTWTGLEGDIESDASRWTGSVAGLPARCGRDGRAPAPIDLDLMAIDVGVVDGGWKVTGFRGTAGVSFRCPGFPRASATVSVTGSV